MVGSRLCAALSVGALLGALLVAPRGARAGGSSSADKGAARAERWEKKSEAVKPDRTAGDDQDDGEHLQKKSKASGKKADQPAGEASGEASDE